jgi:hypothetical protein
MLNKSHARVFGPEMLAQALVQQEAARVFRLLHAQKIRFLVFKGFSYHQYLYENESFLRPCCDIDLWVDEKDFFNVKTLLESDFYESGPYLNIFHEQPVWKTLPMDVQITWDIHYRWTDRFPYAYWLDFQAEWARSRVIDFHTTHFNVPEFKTELLITFSHPLLHHRGYCDIRWQRDLIRFLTRTSPEILVPMLEALASENQLFLGAPIWETVREYIPQNSTRVFLERQFLHLTLLEKLRIRILKHWLLRLLSDLIGMSSFRDRVTYLKTIFFPPKSYLLAKAEQDKWKPSILPLFLQRWTLWILRCHLR